MYTIYYIYICFRLHHFILKNIYLGRKIFSERNFFSKKKELVKRVVKNKIKEGRGLSAKKNRITAWGLEPTQPTDQCDRSGENKYIHLYNIH